MSDDFLNSGAEMDGEEILASVSAVKWSEEQHEAAQRLFARAMAGEFSRGRDLRYWENLQLKPVHMQMAMMLASGFTNKEVAEAFHYSESRVSVLANHPDIQGLVAGLIALASKQLTDVMEKAIACAPAAFDRVFSIMNNTSNEKLASMNAFKIMELAGYSGVKRSVVEQSGEIQHNHRHEIGTAQAGKLARAIEIDAEINHSEVSQHVRLASQVVESESGQLRKEDR